MMCGYSLNHSKGVYRMYDFDTEKICISRDIKWLGLMYKDWKFNRNDIKDQERDNTPVNNGLMEYNRVYKPSEELEEDNESVDSFERNRLMRSEICKDNIIERRLRSQVVMSILRSYDNEETYIDPIWFNEDYNHENSEER